jgi:hypothetical protein
MADVEMKDAPVAPKQKKTGESSGGDSKKPRFEVKKVGRQKLRTLGKV